MKPVVIFGTGTFAECVHFYLTNDSEYKIVAFAVDRESINKDTFNGLPVIPFDEVETVYPPDKFDMFIAVGYQNLNSLREKKFCEAKDKGYKLISYICSKSTVWKGLKIGENCLIIENNIIQPFVTIEDNVIIWAGNLIAHGTHLAKNCFITSCSVIAGNANIGENCFIGVNSTIRERVRIAKNCTIGANSFITKDTREGETYISEHTKPSRMSSRMLQYVEDSRKR
jgi:sugar O-acyltransferase (sialic acid O-acetyltransferase NeuD family)